jgi:hypothetical protein
VLAFVAATALKSRRLLMLALLAAGYIRSWIRDRTALIHQPNPFGIHYQNKA